MALVESIIPYPFFKDLRSYSARSFVADLFAAFSVALMALPQAMACAFVAELPVSAGIFSAIFGTIFGAAFGSSRYLVIGPSTTLAILMQSGTADILFSYYRDVGGPAREILALQIILQTALLMGFFQILAGWLKLGRLTQFASRSVVIGYVAGAALAIVITQLFSFFGIPEAEDSSPLYQQFAYFLNNFFTLDLSTMCIGLGCLVLLFGLQRLSPKIPAMAIVFALSTIIVQFLGIEKTEGTTSGVALVEDFGTVTSVWPQLAFPQGGLNLLLKTLPLAVALTVLSALETTTLGRLNSDPEDTPYSDNQEIYGLGMSNLASAFMGGMPNSGSFSRTALNIVVGAKTRFAAAYSGGFVFLFVLLLGHWVMKIPLPALSASLLFAAYAMVDVRELVTCIKATLTDGFVVLGTFCASFLFPLDVAFYIGVGLSIIFYLKQAGVPRFVEYTFTNMGKLRPMNAGDQRPDPRICILQAEGELFFGAAEPLLLKIRQIAEDDFLKVIILQLFNVRSLDASICLSLQKASKFLQAEGKTLLISGVTPDVEATMRHAGVVEQIGIKHFYPSNERLPSEPTRKAYADAKTLLELI